MPAKCTSVPRVCQHCGRTFLVIPSRIASGGGKFCTLRCSGAARTTRVERSCETCAKTFTVAPSQVVAGYGRFCSYPCANRALANRLDLTCEHCGKAFTRVPSQVAKHRHHFCSPTCMGAAKRRDIVERLWARVTKSPDLDGCWRCSGPSSNGYVIIWEAPGRGILAHRLSYELAYGPIPEGLVVQHACDVPNCVNPAHLFPGNAATNRADSVLKGRHAHGESHGRSRLTGAQVLEIRRRAAIGPVSYPALAREYGVKPGTIGGIIRRKTWQHL